MVNLVSEEQINDAQEILWETIKELNSYEELTAYERQLLESCMKLYDLSCKLGRYTEIAAKIQKNLYENLVSVRADVLQQPVFAPAERDVLIALEGVLGILAPDADADDVEPPAKPKLVIRDADEIATNWVLLDDGNVYVQVPDDNSFGFSLSDGENTWAGGLPGRSWVIIPDDDERITEEHRSAMAWLFDEPAPRSRLQD